MVPVLVLLGLLGAALTSAGCGSLQRAADRDPMRCERDPKCKNKADKSYDCAAQCVDDPACMDRCRSVTRQR